MKFRTWMLIVGMVTVAGLLAQSQGQKPASPAGTAATQVGGKYVEGKDGQRRSEISLYWIEVTYGRPIKRGRPNLFGTGADYGKTVNDGAPVWRAGANQTTRLRTEVELMFDDKHLKVGEYSVFVDLKPKAWTLIISKWPAQQNYDPNNKAALWGAYGYTSDRDVLRVPMKLSTLPFSMDQFTIAFIDMTGDSGKLALMWDKTMASVPFRALTR